MHLEARRIFRELAMQHGLSCHIDGAGNHSALLQCSNAQAPTLLCGSHLDSVPHGGRFDGTLGVAAALEAILAIREANRPLTMHLEVIDFTDEEGTWVSLLGSRAITGQLRPADLKHPRGRPEAFQQALDRANLTREGILAASRTHETLAGYLEVHIEQGTRLIDAQCHIGIVSDMVGIHMYLVTFHGRADHAGTCAMEDRLDAAQGASAFCLAVRQTVLNDFPDCRANVGHMTVSPGAFNIVPETVTLCLELRSQDVARARELEHALQEEAHRAATTYGLTGEFTFLETVEPASMDTELCRTMEQAATHLGLTHKRLPSLAGHDAQSMARICPSGLLFLPSIGGFSHSSRENTPWPDCVNGANTLLHTILARADSDYRIQT